MVKECLACSKVQASDNRWMVWQDMAISLCTALIPLVECSCGMMVVEAWMRPHRLSSVTCYGGEGGIKSPCCSAISVEGLVFSYVHGVAVQVCASL